MMNKDKYIKFTLFCDGGYRIEPHEGASGTFSMGVTKLSYDEQKNILNVHLRRPGLLIGKHGKNIEALEKYLDCKIHIHEVKQLWDEQ
jgi:hypothetical protein